MFDSNYEPIEEGPVRIEFEKSNNGKAKFSISIDFAKTDCTPSEAADLFKLLIAQLRSSLRVDLSKIN